MQKSRIFFPFQKDANPFFDEVMHYSSFEYVFADFTLYDASFPIVSIHWPEAIFDWREPSDAELEELESSIKKWKINSKIVFTVHNLEPHQRITQKFKKLYSIIEENTDFFVHLGKFSKRYFEGLFPNKTHTLIFHPLYSNSYTLYDKIFARKKLGISQEALVLFASGKIRNKSEKAMVINSFESIELKDKVLISNNMFLEKIKKEYPGKYFFKKFFDSKGLIENIMNKNYKPPKYLFNYGFVDAEKLSLFMAASDIIFIPRIKILNSGNIFLGLTFNKVVIGPNEGNIPEILEAFRLPIFNPKDINSINLAIQKAVQLSGDINFKLNADLLSEFQPKKIAQDWDCLFDDIIRNKA